MPFGKHKGEKLANVPAEYLLFLREEWEDRKPVLPAQIELKKYIDDNLEVLRMERKRGRALG
jgi:uncharacterized protein (DUF3820 family)